MVPRILRYKFRHTCSGICPWGKNESTLVEGVPDFVGEDLLDITSARAALARAFWTSWSAFLCWAPCSHSLKSNVQPASGQEIEHWLHWAFIKQGMHQAGMRLNGERG